jgi:ATP-dependent DNA helicase HFM1/MER3
MIPEEWKPVFPYHDLTTVQKKCFTRLFETDRNVVISAPTGTGKTGCMDIALIRLLYKSDRFSAIYIAPTKALCGEREADWRERFGRVGRECKSFTGDIADSDITVSDIMYVYLDNQLTLNVF